MWNKLSCRFNRRCLSRRHSIGPENIHFHGPMNTRRRGVDILHDPVWNKDLAFEGHERDRLGLRGLLPASIQSIEAQVQRVLRELDQESDDIHKNVFLSDLQNRNETLFNRVLVDNVEKIAPLVYTPTVGQVCQQFGFRFNRARGMYLSISDAGQLSSLVHNWPHDDVRIIVVTDGSRILGLGDLGAQGMGIPIGKLALYCAVGGVAPHRVLPITLDVGTNNETLLNDADYVGLRLPRAQGESYFRFLDEFMEAVTRRWPKVTVQFEDFETSKALPLLARYRHKYRCFNDDIQGTGAVTLAGLLAASRHANDTPLTSHRILCAGAGAGGLGVCRQLMSALLDLGLSREDAQRRFVICTSKGALGRRDNVYGDPHHKTGTAEERLHWCHPEYSDGTPMEIIADEFKPTVLLGLTGKPNTFKQELLQKVARHCERPIVIPMSNPTTNSECTAHHAYEWTEGRAVVATGSPFGPVTLSNGKVLHPSQCNNMFIFPGMGLAASIGGMKTITDGLFLAAAQACSLAVNETELERGQCFPDVSRIRHVSHAVACGVLKEALKLGLVTNFKECDIAAEGLENYVDRKMYFPYYVPLL